MVLMVGILRSLILLGAVQGFIIVGLLVVSARRDPAGARAKQLLATMIFLLALACLNIYLYSTDALNNTPIGNLISALVPTVIVMPIGPLIYFHIRSCLEPEFRVDRKARRHFYPVVLDLFQHFVALLYIIALIVGWLDPHRNYGLGNWIDDYDQYVDIPRWISLAIYLRLSSRYLAKARASASPEDLVWPRKLVRAFTVFCIIWLLHLIPYELPQTGQALIDRFDWYPLYLPIVVLIYWLGVKGYFIVYRSAPDRNPGVRSALMPEVVQPAVLALKKAMEQDTLWLEPALSLGMLARHCGLAPKTLSAVLNQHLEKTFNEFVNDYRIAAFKDRILQPASRELTIAGLAYECGFNSLPTFQRAFKSSTGITPKEYLQKNTVGNTDQIGI